MAITQRTVLVRAASVDGVSVVEGTRVEGRAFMAGSIGLGRVIAADGNTAGGWLVPAGAG
ncbi:hypothetical protein GCM10009589_36090 [Arthrobacter pascens]